MRTLITLQNFDKVRDELKAMPDKLMVKAVRPATRNSIKFVAEDMRRRAPQREGWIKKSIGVASDSRGQWSRFRRFNPRDWVSYIAGPIKAVVPAGHKLSSGRIVTKRTRPWWAIFVEGGTKSRFPIRVVNKRVLATYGKAIGGGEIIGEGKLLGKYRSSYYRSAAKQSEAGWIFFGREVTGRGQSPQPFVRPALDENVQNVLNRMHAELAAAIHALNRR